MVLGNFVILFPKIQAAQPPVLSKVKDSVNKWMSSEKISVQGVLLHLDQDSYTKQFMYYQEESYSWGIGQWIINFNNDTQSYP